MKKIVLDFDGPINNYKGWRNEGFDTILDEPVGCVWKAIEVLRARGYEVCIHSTRCAYPGGMTAIYQYLKKYEIPIDVVSLNKPPADAYIDDKGVWYDGDWGATLERLEVMMKADTTERAI